MISAKAGNVRYTVEYRRKNSWDAGFTRDGVFVHYIDETRNASVLIAPSSASTDMQPGDVYLVPSLRVSVASIDAGAGEAFLWIRKPDPPRPRPRTRPCENVRNAIATQMSVITRLYRYMRDEQAEVGRLRLQEEIDKASEHLVILREEHERFCQ